MNSDHENFAAAGIPAFRLVAGFCNQKAATSLVLTDRDKRDLANPDQLANASKLTLEIVSQALKADAAQVTAWRP